MQENRFYQRYAIIDGKKGTPKVEVKFDGIPVRVVDFSVGDLSVISEKPFIVGDIVNISVELENRGRIDLLGRVARVNQFEKAWAVEVDLTRIFANAIMKR